MRLCSCFLAVCAALALLAGNGRADNKIPGKLVEALVKAETFDVYSLDPTPPKENEKPKNAFRGWKVVGKTSIRDTETRRKVLTSLVKSVSEHEGTAGDGFNPRLGLRVFFDGKTYDLVICYECDKAEVYSGQDKIGDFLLTDSSQPVFDQILKDAKVPLAEIPKKELPLPGFPNIKYNADLLDVVGRADKPLLKIIKTEYDKNKKEISWLVEAQSDITYEDYLAILNAWHNDYNVGAKGPVAHFFGKDHVKLFTRDLKEVGELRDARKHDCIRLTLEVGNGFDDATSMEIRRP